MCHPYFFLVLQDAKREKKKKDSCVVGGLTISQCPPMEIYVGKNSRSVIIFVWSSLKWSYFQKKAPILGRETNLAFFFLSCKMYQL